MQSRTTLRLRLDRHAAPDLDALDVDPAIILGSSDAIIGPMPSGKPARPSAVMSEWARRSHSASAKADRKREVKTSQQFSRLSKRSKCLLARSGIVDC